MERAINKRYIMAWDKVTLYDCKYEIIYYMLQVTIILYTQSLDNSVHLTIMLYFS